MTFTQLTARVKNFLTGWMLVLGLKEGLVKCAALCVKSEVILVYSVGFTDICCVEEQKRSVRWSVRMVVKSS